MIPKPKKTPHFLIDHSSTKISIINLSQHQNVPQVTREFRQEDMYADIVDIASIPTLPAKKTISICGYVRKVSTIMQGKKKELQKKFNNSIHTQYSSIYKEINLDVSTFFSNQQIFNSTYKNDLEKATLEVSTNYDAFVTINIWRRTVLQLKKLCKCIKIFLFQCIYVKMHHKISVTLCLLFLSKHSANWLQSSM